MWFWPVNEMTQLVLHSIFFFLILRTPNTSSRTPGWILRAIMNHSGRESTLRSKNMTQLKNRQKYNNSLHPVHSHMHSSNCGCTVQVTGNCLFKTVQRPATRPAIFIACFNRVQPKHETYIYVKIWYFQNSVQILWYWRYIRYINICRHQWPSGLRRGPAHVSWDCGIESRRGHRYLLWVLCAVR